MSEKGMFGVAGTGDTSGYGGLERQQASANSSQRPYGSYFDDIADQLERAYPEFNDAIERVVVDRGELTLHIKREKLVEVALVLRNKLRFEVCLGVSGVHYPADTGRELHAVYPLLSMTNNRRIRLEVSVPDSIHIFHHLSKSGLEIIGMSAKLLTCSELFLTDIQR